MKFPKISKRNLNVRIASSYTDIIIRIQITAIARKTQHSLDNRIYLYESNFLLMLQCERHLLSTSKTIK